MKTVFLNIFSSKKIIWLLLLIMLWSFFSLKRWDKAETGWKLIDWDVTSYYSYLPALFIHNDVALEFTKRGADVSYERDHQFWYLTADNGRRIIKVTMGMSFLYAPFFLMAHASAYIFGYNPNGFSTPYEFFLALSSLFYLFIGLIYLRKNLLLFFSEFTTSITLLCILLGTNLYYYTTSEPAMSHAYSFALISVFIYHTIKWHASPSFKKSILIGLLFGLIVLIRPVNITIIFFPIFYSIYSRKTFFEKMNVLTKNKKHILILSLTAFLVFLPQLIYWRYLTGQWLFNSYVDERFYFNNPHVLLGLFSFRNGWLIYSPIMLFSIIGIVVLYKFNKALFLPILFITFLNIFICYSWWAWWYGGSFGSRPMVDSYALLAMPMAAFFESIYARLKMLFVGLIGVLLFFIYLNLFQTYQRRIGLIHWDSMTLKSYKIIFLKSKLTSKEAEEFNSVLFFPDYDIARKGEEE